VKVPIEGLAEYGLVPSVESLKDKVPEEVAYPVVLNGSVRVIVLEETEQAKVEAEVEITEVEERLQAVSVARVKGNVIKIFEVA